ncbi:unnamed protein product [Coregonus sp. 'balchen']|nr:unnamed protein product [Coregonus sp. 'balchen']
MLFPHRVFDYQRVPASMMPVPVEPSPIKRSRGPSSSSGLHRSRDRPQGKRSAPRTGSSSTRAKYSPPTGEGSVSDSVSSLDDSPVSLHHRQRESPEPGEASDDDHLQHNTSTTTG